MWAGVLLNVSAASVLVVVAVVSGGGVLQLLPGSEPVHVPVVELGLSAAAASAAVASAAVAG